MAIGGGVYMQGGSLQNCIVSSNYVYSPNGREEGGGILINGTGFVDRCVISYNETRCNGYASQDGGAGVWMNGGAVRNCLIVGNRTQVSSAQQKGAGVRMQGGSMENCTIARNRSATTEGGVYIAAGGVTNCIIADNISVSAPTNVGPMSQAAFSCSPDLVSGPGNITADPRFVISGSGWGTNAVLGSYQLAEGSPCVNAGTNFPWMIEDALDLAGYARVIRGRVDMGAYEQHTGRGTVFLAR